MKERLNMIAAELTEWSKAVITFPWLGTFHSMFLKLLKREIGKTDWGFSTDFVVYDENEAQSVIKEIIKELKMEDDMEVKEAKSAIGKYKNQGIAAKQMNLWADSGYDQTVGMIYTKYEKKLQDNNAMDFDDLLFYSYKLFKEYPELLAHWQDQFTYILVDEAQDTNRIQFELLKLLTAKWGNITFIGDDYQSIYRRRGAMMENFLQVKKIWPDIEIFKLRKNYRSRPHIVHAGNHIIKNNKKQYDKEVVAHREGNDRIMVFTHSSDTEEATNIIQLIQKLTEDGKKQWGDISILYRTNAQSASFEQLLLQETIPYKIYGWFKFFERKEVKDVVSYLKFFVNPRDTVAMKRIINTPKRKIGQDTVEKLDTYAKENSLGLYEVLLSLDSLPIALGPQTKTAVKQFMTSMQFLGTVLENATPDVFISQLVTTIRYKDFLYDTEGTEVGNEKYENIGQLINMAMKFAEDKVDQESKGKAALASFIEEISLLTDVEETADGGTNTVHLMSIHASKWLEFPVVFVVWLEEGIFPLGNAAYDEDAMEEERRLMYVALTRAKDHLFLSHANSRRQWWQLKYNEASRFIGELPEELVKRFDFSMGGEKPSTRKATTTTLNIGDMVFHKLFGKGQVVEVRHNMVVVQFGNPKFGLRKMDAKFLEKK